MTNENLFSDKKLRRIEPHLRTIFKKELQKAYDSFLNSEEVTTRKVELESNKEYIDKLEAIKEDETFIEKIIGLSFPIFVETKQVDTLLNHTILNSFHKNKNLSYIDSFLYSDEYYKIRNELESEIENEENSNIEFVKNIVLEGFRKICTESLENDVLYRIKNEFNLTNDMVKSNIEELRAVLETSAICSLSELEDKIKSHFDFNKEILKRRESGYYSDEKVCSDCVDF